METWRIIGGAVVGVGGVLLVLVAMAQARDRASVRGRRTRGEGRGARVARAAALGLVALAGTLALVLTVLPSGVVWAVGAAIWLILGAMVFVG